MTTDNAKILENEPRRGLWSRYETVLLAVATALLVGVVVPLPEIVLDILWVCVLSLTIAAVTIFPAAASTADLRGFASLLSVPALLRIGLVGAASARLLQGRPCGLLIPLIGRTVTFLWPLVAALAGLVAAAFCVVALFTACQKIAAASVRYLHRIHPLKCIGIETDLKMGTITTHQAQALAEKVRTESRLFEQLAGASLLMRAEGVVEIAAIIACLVWPFLSSVTAGGGNRIVAASSGAMGLAIFSLVPATLSAIAGAYLAAKDSLTLRPAPDAQEPTGRAFTLVDRDTGRNEDVELLNPDFAAHSNSPAETAHEQLAEFEPKHNAVLIETLAFSGGAAQDYYRQLAAHIAKAGTASQTIVFTSERVEDLPVTVFVNSAIQLVRQDQKLLLVDADRHRKALAQVFDAKVDRLRQTVQATAFEGLDICGMYDDPGHIETILTTAAQPYAYILIYAPDAAAWHPLATAIQTLEPTAFVFGLTGNIRPTGLLASALGCCRQVFSAPPLPLTDQVKDSAAL